MSKSEFEILKGVSGYFFSLTEFFSIYYKAPVDAGARIWKAPADAVAMIWKIIHLKH